MALGRAYIEIVGDVRKFAPDLRRGLTKALKIGAVGTVAASATSQLLGLVGALSSVGGAAFAIPGALAVGVAAIGALRVATTGLGDAFKAAATGDAAAFQKAIENLSPQAQRLATEFRAVKPALDGIRSAAQGAFAAPIVGQIRQTASVLAGPLRSGLAGIAAEYGRAAREALTFARDGTTVSVLRGVLMSAQGAVANLTVSLKPLLTGFRDLAVVALPTIGQLSLDAGGAAAQFGEWLSAMAQSGAAVASIQTALGVLSQLGQMAANVGGILSEVLSAASASASGGLLGSLVVLTGAVREFFASAEGGAALTGIFEALGVVASGLSPLLLGLFRAIGETLVPALMPVAQALAPALQALVPALAPIGQVIASLAVAIAPVLPVVAQLISMLVGPLAQALAALGPLLGPIVTALGPVLLQIGQTLTAVLAPIAGLLAELFTQLGPPLGEIVAALGTALAPVLDALGPLIVQVVQALMPLIPALVSLLPPVVEIIVALTPLIELVAQLAAVAVALVAPLLKVVAMLVAFLAAEAVAPLVSAIASALAWLLSPLSGVADWLGRVAAWLNAIDWAGVGSAIGGAFTAAWNAVVGFFQSIGTWFAELLGKIGAFLSSLPQMLWNLFTAAANMALQAVGVGIGLILYSVTILPGQIIGFLAKLPSMLGTLFAAAWNLGRQVFLAGVTAVVGFAVALPGRVISGLSSLASRLRSTFTSAVTAGRAAAVNGFNSIVSFIAGIPGRISGYAGRFLSAGSGLIKKLVDGLRKVPSLGSIADAISGTIKRQLNNIIGSINAGIARVDALLPGSLPRIPHLANGAILRRPTLAMVGEAGAEVVIPLTRPRRARQLAEESGLLSLLAGEAGSGRPVVFNRGAISVVFEGVVPTEQEAWRTGRAVGDGVWETLARRSVATTVRTI
ncbi:hypothetical protein [Micromonospora sp. KC721]|uniref:hypothetical protein n=1 Tax=Micromonospora sp. KC721 TaxID=2530380 RepID=UPI0010539535|nr:hypothetical protein [Micromonospora sp. KC721]TDB80956.1 hypothetical protein E1182_07085 [Micromonospora sp. KC721]